MSDLKTMKEFFGNKKFKCTICGEKEVTAYWRGIEDIFICRSCAVSVLPRLYADALGIAEIKNPYRITDELLKELYLGIIFRLLRK